MDIRPLLKQYDCLGWVPSIKGALSFSLTENASNIFGDVDKYSFHVKQYEGLKSVHYLAATSLHTVNDTKHGPQYSRTFRYLFFGTVNKDCSDGLLHGRLVVISEKNRKLSGNIVSMLTHFQNLTEQKEEYDKAFHNKAVTLAELANQRKGLISKWKEVIDSMEKAEKAEKAEEDKNVTLVFDILMTMDGILLIKNKTDKKYNDSIAKKGSENDYTKNVPLHRVFKIAMNYIKYLFHSNYHHDKNHDTLLPASNLHPWIKKKPAPVTYSEVFRHQLDSLLDIVTQMKRKHYRRPKVNPEGVLQYARAMVNVFRNNSLICAEEAKNALDFIDIQKAEIDIQMQDRKSILSFAHSQNWLVILASALAILACIINICSPFVCLNKLHINDIDKHLFVGYTSFVSGSLVFILVLYWITRRVTFKRNCYKKAPSLPFRLFRHLKITKSLANSNLKARKYGKGYSVWIKLRDIKLYLMLPDYYFIKMELWIIVTCTIILLTVRAFQLL